MTLRDASFDRSQSFFSFFLNEAGLYASVVFFLT